MRRRDISNALFASAATALVQSERAGAQTCTAPCYAQTPAELAARIMPTNTSFPPGQVDRYFSNTTPGTTPANAGFASAIAQAQQMSGGIPIGAPVTVNGPLAISTSGGGVTIPAATPFAPAVLLQFISGVINIASGAVLQINGAFTAPRVTCFRGSGSVAFGSNTLGGAGTVIELYPEWWGARADSTPGKNGVITTTGTDCTNAIESCLNAAAGGSATGIGLVPIRFGPGYYLTGPQRIPVATTMRGTGREQSGFIAKAGTTGIWWQESSVGAAKIIIEDLAFYCAYASSPSMTFGLRLGYLNPASPHGTEGYLQGLWIRDCACYNNGFQCDVKGNVGFYNLLTIYSNNQFQQSGLRISGGANRCSNLAVLAPGGQTANSWSASANYLVDQFVSSGGSIYQCIAANSGQMPPNATYWSLYTTVPITYGVYLIAVGTQVTGLEIEAPATGAISLSIQQNTDISGVVFALADGTILDHVWELGPNATTWKLTGTQYVFGSKQTARVTGGNGLRADGTYFGGNATGINNPTRWSPSPTYTAGTLVRAGGVVYICILANSGQMPPNPTYWNAYALFPYAGNGNWFSDTNGQRLQSFTLRIQNSGGTLQHRIAEPGGSPTNFASVINAAIASYTTTPTGTDGTTSFAGGGKIGSAAPSIFWLDTPNQTIADTIGLAFISYNSTGMALNVVAAIASLNINGVTQNRLYFQFTTATSGASFSLNTTNIPPNAILQVSWIGNISN